MNTPLFLLRCVQIGLSLRELDLLTIGMVNDLFIERGNDDYSIYDCYAISLDEEENLWFYYYDEIGRAHV